MASASVGPGKTPVDVPFRPPRRIAARTVQPHLLYYRPLGSDHLAKKGFRIFWAQLGDATNRPFARPDCRILVPVWVVY